AENERMAHVLGNGETSGPVFQLHHCSHYILEGLRFSDTITDFCHGGGCSAGGLFAVWESSDITLCRLLVHSPNNGCPASYPGYCNNIHPIAIAQSERVTAIETEIYDFFRHGMAIYDQ